MKSLAQEISMRQLAIVMLLELSALILGIAFFMIVFSLIHGVLLFSPHWEPAHRIYCKVLKVQGSEFVRAPLSWKQVALLGIKFLYLLIFLAGGLYALMAEGFLGQNFIYHFMTYVSPSATPTLSSPTPTPILSSAIRTVSPMILKICKLP